MFHAFVCRRAGCAHGNRAKRCRGAGNGHAGVTRISGGDGWDGPELISDAGEELEGALFTNFYAPDVPWASAKEFRTSYTARFKRDPSSNAAMGYDAFPATREQFAEFLAAESAKYAAVIKRAKVSLD